MFSREYSFQQKAFIKIDPVVLEKIALKYLNDPISATVWSCEKACSVNNTVAILSYNWLNTTSYSLWVYDDVCWYR